MDFNTLLQAIFTGLAGLVLWYFKQDSDNSKKRLDQHDEELNKSREYCAREIAEARADAAAQISKVSESLAAEIKRVDQKLENLRADLPLLYTTREDYIRTMNNMESLIRRLEEKLTNILTQFTRDWNGGKTG